jgi:serine/threonine protein kinase
MPVMLQPGHRVASPGGGYSIVNELRRGNWSNSYLASRRDGSRAFLKQYKTPTPALAWYEKYLEYERTKLDRLTKRGAHRYCLLPTEIFEAKDSRHSPANTLYQAFDFIDDGDNLKDLLVALSRKPIGETWSQRLTFARVFLAALDAVAAVGLVHGDLKPENIHLIRDSAITVGYRPRLIDMDGSILVDIQAPWHGKGHGCEGYLGTPGYISPEHGVKPVPASDVFTASLIIHELLCRERPHPEYGTPEEIVWLLSRQPAPLPALRGDLGSPTADRNLRETLQACLHLKAECRPTLADLRAAVMGKVPSRPAPPLTGTLCLRHSSGAERKFRIRTEFGRALARLLHSSGAGLREVHFVVQPDEGGAWKLDPVADAAAARIRVNGEPISAPRVLRHGDRIAVGPLGPAAEQFEVEVVAS